MQPKMLTYLASPLSTACKDPLATRPPKRSLSSDRGQSIYSRCSFPAVLCSWRACLLLGLYLQSEPETCSVKCQTGFRPFQQMTDLKTLSFLKARLGTFLSARV